MPEFLTILILVPTAAVVAAGALYILAMIAMGVAAGVDAVVVATRHRIHHTGHMSHA
jgi:hypothetical protein